MTAGLLAPGGEGNGEVSGVTVLVGSGRAGAFRLLLLFALAFSLALLFAAGLISWRGVGETAALAFAFTVGLMTPPPAGIPASPCPVGG